MKRLILILAIMPPMALAAGSWDGTWRTKVESIKTTGKPDVYEVSGGQFQCLTCVPPIAVPADGKDHAVTGHPYYDTYAVQIHDPMSIESTSKLKGVLMFTDKMSVSADHNTLTESLADHSGAKVATATVTSKRASPGKTGSHAISGSWQQGTALDASDTAITVTMQSTENGLKMTWNGIVTDAKFDGKPVAAVGDPGHTMAALTKVSADTIEETDTRDSKIVDVTRSTLAKDGQSLSVVDHDKLHDITTTYTMLRVH